jgi:mono/diheme cytochrome c family protein
MKILVVTASILVGLSGLSCLCAAQSKPEKTERASGYGELEKAPAKYRTRPNPMLKDKDAVAAGKVLFEEHCAECHGESGLGSNKAPALRAQEVQLAPAGSLFWILTNGVVRKGMPVWSKLPEPQRWQLVTYIQSLGPADPSESRTNVNAKP